MNRRLRCVVAGVLTGAILTEGLAYAQKATKNVEVTYDNIKVYRDNVLCELKDANGSVIEPFIYNGTTYLPVRGAASIAGMDVTWDGQTKSVYLWDEQVPGDTYLLDSCPPYSTDVFDEIYTGDYFEMSGKKYSNGLDSGSYPWSKNMSALFNLDGKYSNLECTIGHTGNDDEEKIISFIVDGKNVLTVELEPECLPKTVSIQLKYGLQLKIVVSEGTCVGIGNMIAK